MPLIRPNDKPEMRQNRVRRVLESAAELARICKTHHWRMDHGHLTGSMDHKRGNGEPVLDDRGRVVTSYVDVACVVTDKGHRVTNKCIGYDGERADLRLMASMGPDVMLQMREDFEQIIADYEARIAMLTDKSTDYQTAN